MPGNHCFHCVLLSLVLIPVALVSGAAWSAPPVLEIVDHAPYIGPQVDFGSSAYRPYDTSQNLAYQGNGFAKPAVAYNTIVGWSIHKAWFANDGNYGNGRSWIGIWDGANFRDLTWVKIDLGRSVVIDEIRFGETRLQCYDDRTAVTFRLGVASTDAVYAEGDETNDDVEYTEIASSDALGYDPDSMGGCRTLSIRFDPVETRFVKISVTGNGTRIDEIEVFGPPVAEAVDVITLSDMNRNDTPELAVLRRLADGSPEIAIKDSMTKETVNTITMAPTDQQLAGIAEVLDMDGNGHPEIAVLFVQANGRARVVVKDAMTGLWLNEFLFFDRDWTAKSITTQDGDGDGVSEIVVLAERDDGSLAAVFLKDALSGEPFNWVGLPAE